MTIHSVLEVQEDVSLPNAQRLHAFESRHILILTPAGTLSFMADTTERHTLWMTALNFLGESARMGLDPPLPYQSHRSPLVEQQGQASCTAKILDSLRLTEIHQPPLQRNARDENDDAEMVASSAPQSDIAESLSVPRLPRDLSFY